jgi:hypothetical protein
MASILRLTDAFGSDNAKSPSASTDGLMVFLSSGTMGCGDRQPPTVADRVPKLTPHLVTERQDELNFQL